MGDLGKWAHTVTTVGYGVVLLAGFLFGLVVVGRLGDRMPGQRVPDGASAEPERRRPPAGGTWIAGLAIVLVGGWFVISWGGPQGLFGDLLRSWLGTTMPYGLTLALIGSFGVVHDL